MAIDSYNPIDVLLGDDGDLPAYPEMGRGIRVTMQAVETVLNTHLGDWPLQQREGIPYIEYVQQKPVQTSVIGAFIRREIEGVPGVLRVENWSEEFVAASEQLRFSGIVLCPDGDFGIEVSPPGIGGNFSVLTTITHRSGTIA